MINFAFFVTLQLVFTALVLAADLDQSYDSCDVNYPYRRLSGRCNNLKNPLVGSAGTIYRRMFPANYADGVSKVRKSVTGTDLPSARLISSKVLDSQSHPLNNDTLFTMQWGQFLDHDIAFTKVIANDNGTGIQCCSKPQIGQLVSPLPHPECLPVLVAKDDPLYNSGVATNNSQPIVDCMSVVRSQFGNNIDGSKPKTRQQKNSNTHWIDGSHIYGSDNVVTESLRDPSSGTGQLKISRGASGRVLLPISPRCCPNDPSNSCPASVRCFTAGDDRLNQHASLTALHTIWLREHNRVAKELVRQMPGRSDHFYFQQARRIVIAELQHITYNEYLPTILGKALADKVFTRRNYRGSEERRGDDDKSSSSSDEHQYNYHHHHDHPYNPSIFTEFNTAAYRFGHSQAKTFIELFEADGSLSDQSFSLANSLQASGGPFFPDRQGFLNPRFLDNAMRGLLRSNLESVDRSFSEAVHGQMFRFPGAKVGFDLMSINIQRGRDHGLPTYADVRGIKSFDNLKATTPQEVIAAMKQVYASVFDIDLFVGGVTENPIAGGLVGPTFANMIALQFRNLKFADRFFYDDLSQSVSFTKSQLDEIQKVSLARIVCDNSDGTVTSIQPNAFKGPTGNNAPIPCSKIPGIDIKKFVRSITK